MIVCGFVGSSDSELKALLIFLPIEQAEEGVIYEGAFCEDV